MVREEYNLPLTQEAYEHLKPKIDGRLIKKKRYVIPLDGGLALELDIFEDSLAPLVIAEMAGRRCDNVTSLSQQYIEQNINHARLQETNCFFPHLFLVLLHTNSFTVKIVIMKNDISNFL